MRSSALLEYLSQRFEVDLITFARDVPGAAWIELPRHSRSLPAKAWRNARRFALGRPPLLDRYSGFGEELLRALPRQDYELAVIEHFWCAPYAAALRPRARRLVLDLHNTESDLARTVANSEPWPVSAMFRRFAAAYERLEREWLPRFDAVLATSRREAEAARAFGANAILYPNTIPFRPVAQAAREDAIIFTGNLEYHPNVSAVRWFAREIWPLIRAKAPRLEWRLVGKNPGAVEREVAGVGGVRVIGPVDDAIAQIARARIAVAPMRAGSGTRFKIVEAWCAGTPAVSTTLGAEGLEAEPGRDLAIADRSSGFADAVLLLAGDEAEGARLARNGRRLFERRFTTEAGWKLLDESGVFSW